VAVRFRNRCHRLPDALPALLALVVVILVLAPPASAFAQDHPGVFPLAPLHAVPAPTPILVRPRVVSAYGALIAGAMLSVLYLYRGRPFIVYWLGSCGLLAAGLAIASVNAADPRLADVLTGVALMWMVWSAGLLRLAADAFPQNALRWSTPLKIAAATTVWFLALPFLIPAKWLVASGVLAGAALLGSAAARYLRLAKQWRHAGALLIGAGLAIIGAGNAAAVAIALGVTADSNLVNRLSAINVVVALFIALGMHLLVFEDMTNELRRTNRELESANDAVKRLAITDALTGCHNRRFFEEIERREMQRHRRYGAPLSVVFIDINHFKQLNDSLGHDRGDEALRAIGAMLRRHVRESDYVIRWGGDEFLLLLTCGAAEAQAKAADLKRAFGEECELAGMPQRIGLSMGVAPVSLAADNLQDAIKEADARMYRDKLGDRGTPSSVGKIEPVLGERL
jgi:diguanylate cyclase (GGDEF)-like protein